MAIFGRIDAKDFIDLYYLLKVAKFDFDKLYQLAGKKDLGLNYFYLALALEGIKKATEWPRLLKLLDKQILLNYFEKLHRKVLAKIDPRE